MIFKFILLNFLVSVIFISHVYYVKKTSIFNDILSNSLYSQKLSTNTIIMFKKIVFFTVISLFLTSCGTLKPKKVDTRETSTNAQERARKNIEEGRGTSIGGLLGVGGNTSYEFSTSNPLWRASLEILDFLPLTTVDYSGGIIVTDWYSEINANDAVKISVRFLGNEVRTENIKVIVHKKICKDISNCKVSQLTNSKISEELLTTIIRKAALLEKNSKEKKSKK